MKAIEKALKWRLDYVGIFLISALYYGILQWNRFIGDPDGFYHAKMALFLRSGQILRHLPWMQTSTLRENFTDHHLLYHIFLAPFTYIVNPLIGAKVATVVLSALMVLSFYWLLKKTHTRWPIFFALLMLTLQGLNFRLTLVKANSASLIVIWFLIYALVQKKYWLVALLGVIFVWLYGGWPLSIVITLAYLASDFGYRQLHQTKFRFISDRIHRWLGQDHSNIAHYWKLPLWLLVGLLIGLIVNPYWPNNLYFYYQQIIQIGLINLGDKFNVGNEWYGTGIFNILSSMPHIGVIAGVCFVVLFYNIKKVRIITIFSFLLTFGFIILTIKSRRYIEYSSPLALFFAACAATDAAKIVNPKVWHNFWKKLPIWLKGFLLANAGVLMMVIIPMVLNKTFDVNIPNRWPMAKFEASTTWLKANTPPKSIIFHSDWDEWPSLFYYDDQNYYLIGLDFTFMYNYDANLQQEYIAITNGSDANNLSAKIKNYFDASYIFVDKEGHGKLIENLNRDKKILLVFSSADSLIYQIQE